MKVCARRGRTMKGEGAGNGACQHSGGATGEGVHSMRSLHKGSRDGRGKEPVSTVEGPIWGEGASDTITTHTREHHQIFLSRDISRAEMRRGF